MSEYKRIKRSCQKRNELWEDTDFPAKQTSVFYHQKPPFQFIWKRPKELSAQPVFVDDNSTYSDIHCGKMGDKWLVSCLGVLYLSRGLFYQVAPADQSFSNSDYAGIFRFRLWWCGEWVDVLVDDRLPTLNGKLVFLQSQHSNQYWPALLEKAYAKLHGSYEALKYGTLLDGLADFTGGIIESIIVKEEPKVSGHMVSKLLEMTSLVTCIAQTDAVSQVKIAEKLSNGIHMGINYVVHSVRYLETCSGETIQVIKLKNPISTMDEYVGSWSQNSSEWNEIPPKEKDRLGIKHMMHGEFWMPLTDFVKTFTHLEVVHLHNKIMVDEPSLCHRNSWHMEMYHGFWQKGVTAGGCRNNPDTFHTNPQINMIINEADEIIISLNQHSIMEPKVIGFTVYDLSKNNTESADRQFFKKQKSLINSQYSNCRQVSQRYHFETGSYLILPTTFDPSQESKFTLRLYSCKSLTLRLLDSLPLLLKSPIIKAPATLLEGKNFGQYESVFLQLADEHGTVNAFELQELLDACLPNDYIKSCACMEVCRQIVMTMDTTATGRLKFNDFKDFMFSLKNWQSIFKNHTKEKTGVLKAERLKDALLDVGFQLNMEVLSVLALKYMRKDGTLRFGDFVSATLHLTSSFRIFEQKDSSNNGTISLILTEPPLVRSLMYPVGTRWCIHRAFYISATFHALLGIPIIG